MGKSDKNMAEHVRSVKMWLERAEKSYDHKSDIQGELNLMLAEAEMKNLRKNHMTGQGIMKIVAAVTAVMLFKESPKRSSSTFAPRPAPRNTSVRYAVCAIHDQLSLPLT